MNQLVAIRQQFMQCKDSEENQYQCHVDFYQDFFGACQDISSVIKKYAYLKFLCQQSTVELGEIYALLPTLGEDIYCDQDIKELLRQHRQEIPPLELIANLRPMALDATIDRKKLICVLEICASMDCGCSPLKQQN